MSVSIVVAGGGTAGHIEPAMNLADAVRRLDPSAHITALGTPKGLDTTLIPARGYPLELVPAPPLPVVRRPVPPPSPEPRRPSTSIARVDSASLGRKLAWPAAVTPLIAERPRKPASARATQTAIVIQRPRGPVTAAAKRRVTCE